MNFVIDLRAKGIEVNSFHSSNTLYFENIHSRSLDHRVQKVLQTTDAFSFEQLKSINAAIFDLGPLLADDIPLESIKALAEKGKVSIDVQGYFHEVENQDVYAVDWRDKMEGLTYVDILKASEDEMEVLTGLTDIRKGAKILNDWGVPEVVITRGNKGSVIYEDHIFHYFLA